MAYMQVDGSAIPVKRTKNVLLAPKLSHEGSYHLRPNVSDLQPLLQGFLVPHLHVQRFTPFFLALLTRRMSQEFLLPQVTVLI